MNLPVARAARAARVPVVMQPHGALPVIVNSFALKRLYDRLLGGIELDATSAFIVGQESERQQALQRSIPADRIHIIYNGLSVDPGCQGLQPGAFRQRIGVAPDRPLILFLARINKKKGADMMVEAFARVKAPGAVLVIAGPDDGQLAEVQSLIEAHRLTERVILPGLLQGDDVGAAFADADLYVLPCRTDTFPQTILEACRAGTPMVISETCETAYLVKDNIGDVVPFDADAFATAIDNLLADRARYARYESACGAMMRDVFNIEKSVDQLEALYRQVISEAR